MLGNIYSHYQLPMGYELWTVDCVLDIPGPS